MSWHLGLTTPKNAMFDIPKFAKMAGVTEGSARNIMTRLRKKIAEEAGGEPVFIEEGKQKKKPAAKRKRLAKGAEVETEAEGEAEASE